MVWHEAFEALTKARATSCARGSKLEYMLRPSRRSVRLVQTNWQRVFRAGFLLNLARNLNAKTMQRSSQKSKQGASTPQARPHTAVCKALILQACDRRFETSVCSRLQETRARTHTLCEVQQRAVDFLGAFGKALWPLLSLVALKLFVS